MNNVLKIRFEDYPQQIRSNYRFFNTGIYRQGQKNPLLAMTYIWVAGPFMRKRACLPGPFMRKNKGWAGPFMRV